MMAGAPSVHRLSFPASFRGHPSSVVLTFSASSCEENQGGRTTVRLMKPYWSIPFGEMRRRYLFFIYLFFETEEPSNLLE